MSSSRRFTHLPPSSTIRYIEDARLPNRPGNNQIKSPDSRGDNIINSEVEILTSLDIAREVVAAIGAEKILAEVGGWHQRQSGGGPRQKIHQRGSAKAQAMF